MQQEPPKTPPQTTPTVSPPPSLVPIKEEEERVFLAYRSWKTKRLLLRRPRRIILIRHGESVANLDSSIYATTPDNRIPLSPKGVEQAEEAGKKLRELIANESATFFVSPFLRSRQTLDAILRSSAIERPVVREDPRLREQEWGNFQDPKKMPELMQKRREVGAFYFRFPEGESGADVHDRISSFLETLFREFKKRECSKNIVLISHGITLRLFLTRYFRWSIEILHDLWNLKNCQMIILERIDPLAKAFCLVTPLESNKGLYLDRIPVPSRLIRHESVITTPKTQSLQRQAQSTILFFGNPPQQPPTAEGEHCLISSFDFPPMSLPSSSSSLNLGEPPAKKQNAGEAEQAGEHHEPSTQQI